MFKFEVLTDEELNRPAFDEGIYYFKVISWVPKYSKSTNKPMVKVELQVESMENPGKTCTVFDYLLAEKQYSWKVSAFCKAINKEGLYKKGAIDQYEVLQKEGRCELALQESSLDGKKYLKVKQYLYETPTQTSVSTDIPFDFNDDIPL